MWPLLYVKHGLGAVQVNVNTDFPEHVWCRLMIKGCDSLLIGVCYITPTERIYGNNFINLHEKLRELVYEVAEQNLILMGDFNYRNTDWKHPCNNGGGIKEGKFLDCVEDCMLTQHVHCLTTNSQYWIWFLLENLIWSVMCRIWVHLIQVIITS